MSGWRVGIDTGGTFTDLVAVQDDETRIVKVPSTPPHYEVAVMDALKQAHIDPSEVDLLAHGTTVATNAVITGAVTRTALLTTAGFRDILELRRHNRGDPFDIMWDPPDPLIPRRHRFEVRERLNYAGEVVQELDEGDVLRAVEAAAGADIACFAICFLHSYANPLHEQRARELVLRAMPGADVCCSAELLREPHEFERTSTTVINACLIAVVGQYLHSLSTALIEHGFRGRLGVMHSGGGLLTLESAARFPARLVTSGPAGGAMAAQGIAGSGSPSSGVVAAEELARAVKLDDIISLDIGGTSADIAVIRGGRARLINEYSAQFGQVIRFPTIDLVTIGAGGGSIAWVDPGRLPHVGPQSAGAVPGPAAYSRGGTQATVTDANVVLGRLGGGMPLAGSVELNAAAAQRAVSDFATTLGLSVEAAALGIVEIVNNNMARSIRVVTVERGLDPREFTLVPFGGAGPLLAAELAEMLGIRRVLIPVAPGVTSALGCLHVDITHDISESFISKVDDLDAGALHTRVDHLAGQMRARLTADRVPAEEQNLEFFVDLRYSGQIKGLTVALPADLGSDHLRRELLACFFDEYERQFHFASHDIDVEVAAIRVHGGRPAIHTSLPFRGGSGRLHDVTRPVVTRRGDVAARVIARQDLPVGTRLAGPIIITQLDSTTWVPSTWSVDVDRIGNLELSLTRPEAEYVRG